MSVKFKYVLVEHGSTHAITNHWAENFKYSVHINDNIVFGDGGSIWLGRVIRRSNVKPRMDYDYSVIATCNQFPVSDAPVQPELPVVSFPAVDKEKLEITKEYLKFALDNLEKI